MTPFIFPATVATFIFGSLVTVFAFEPCILGQSDPKFDCWSSLVFSASFVAIGSVLTGIMALLVRVLLYSYLSFDTPKPEWRAGLLAGIVLTVLFSSIIRWEIPIGHIGIQLFGWLGLSFFVCGSSLLTMKHLALKERSS